MPDNLGDGYIRECVECVECIEELETRFDLNLVNKRGGPIRLRPKFRIVHCSRLW